MRTCSVEGCDRTGDLVRGLCPKHYQRWWKHGDPSVVLVRGPGPPRLCSAPWCSRPHAALGLCKRHYDAHRRNGDLVPRRSGRNPDLDTWVASKGYRRRWDPEHPLAQRSGQLSEHRRILFEELGGKLTSPIDCYFCGTVVWWRTTLECVFLDGDRSNLDVANLVASCARCRQRHANDLRIGALEVASG